MLFVKWSATILYCGGALNGRGGKVRLRIHRPIASLAILARARLAGGARLLVEPPQDATRQGDVDTLDRIIQRGRTDRHERENPAGKFRSRADGFERRRPRNGFSCVERSVDPRKPGSSAPAIASSSVSPAEKAPGKSGMTTPYSERSVRGSIAIG
jgi:hypothetical protein